MMGLGLSLVNWVISRRRGYLGLARKTGQAGLLKAFWRAKLALFLPVIILGGIYGGLFTPTEAAVVGSVYALLIGVVVYRSLNLARIRAAMIEAGLLSAVVMFILGGSTTFSRLLMLERIPTMIAASMMEMFSSPLIIMMVILLFLLVVYNI
jgi:C4-dicarboxylate transporter DctM subunit